MSFDREGSDECEPEDIVQDLPRDAPLSSECLLATVPPEGHAKFAPVVAEWRSDMNQEMPLFAQFSELDASLAAACDRAPPTVMPSSLAPASQVPAQLDPDLAYLTAPLGPTSPAAAPSLVAESAPSQPPQITYRFVPEPSLPPPASPSSAPPAPAAAAATAGKRTPAKAAAELAAAKRVKSMPREKKAAARYCTVKSCAQPAAPKRKRCQFHLVQVAANKRKNRALRRNSE